VERKAGYDKVTEMFGKEIPLFTIPNASSHWFANLIESCALSVKAEKMGYDVPEEFIKLENKIKHELN
jgi:serine kinase of HPr protein (carbohydrate metabolism regulator)